MFGLGIKSRLSDAWLTFWLNRKIDAFLNDESNILHRTDANNATRGGAR